MNYHYENLQHDNTYFGPDKTVNICHSTPRYHRRDRMGNCSGKDNKQEIVSMKIDAEIRADFRNQQKVKKLLLLGAGTSLFNIFVI